MGPGKYKKKQEEHVYCSLIMPQPPKKLPTSKSCQNPQSKHKQKIVLEWRDGGKAPSNNERGGAVGNGNMAYFLNVVLEIVMPAKFLVDLETVAFAD